MLSEIAECKLTKIESDVNLQYNAQRLYLRKLLNYRVNPIHMGAFRQPLCLQVFFQAIYPPAVFQLISHQCRLAAIDMEPTPYWTSRATIIGVSLAATAGHRQHNYRLVW
jgi:hypothetical protein